MMLHALIGTHALVGRILFIVPVGVLVGWLKSLTIFHIVDHILRDLVMGQCGLVADQKVGQSCWIVSQAVDAARFEVSLDMLGHVVPKKYGNLSR